ncbi:ABC transporter substrate-binding protein [Nocardia sp. NPDC058499]|uniref:ABC transporter substrate-binding protein n=1 Tax=Nocardia sp. NPDC058499 TaxID=3346530 RepID=UPI0036507354
MTHRWLRCAALIGAVLLFAACNSATGGTGNTGNKVTVATQPSSTGFPLWLAERLGYYAEAGLDVDLAYFPSGAPLVEAGAGGAWDAGFMGAPPGLTAADKWKMVPAGVNTEEGKTLALWVRRADLSGKTPTEALRGRDILVKTNSTAHYVLLSCLQKLELAGKVNLVPIETNAVPSAFGGGRGGGAMTWPPFDMGFEGNPDYIRVCDGEMAGTPVYDFIGLTQEFAQERPEQADSFLRAAFRANAWIPENRDRAAALLTEYYATQGIDIEPEQAALQIAKVEYLSLPGSVELYRGRLGADLEHLAETFVELGAYQSEPDISAAVSSGLETAERAVGTDPAHSEPDQGE